MAKNEGIFLRLFLKWIPLATIIILFAGLVYATIQQNYRQSANDPQIQMAEDGAMSLATGQSFQSFVPTQTVDIGSSLSPFYAIYNAGGMPVGGNGTLHGQLSPLPVGVFSYTREHGEDRITWQPEPEVRDAVVIHHYFRGGEQGFVMAGRSLREVEVREDKLLLTVSLGAIVTLGVSLFFMLLFG